MTITSSSKLAHLIHRLQDEYDSDAEKASLSSILGPHEHIAPLRITHDANYIMLGDHRYLKTEMAEAFGGAINPGSAPPPKHNLANPAPLGLASFALTTFLLSLINCGARGVHIPNIVVGAAFFYGGAAQVIAGMFEIACGNTFGGVAFASYGGFWAGWAAINVNAFGIASAYKSEAEFGNAVAIMLTGWLIFTFFMTSMTLKSTWGLFSLFFCLTLTFLCLVIAEFAGLKHAKKAGGVLGIITAFIAWYNAFCGLASEQNSYISIKGLKMPSLSHQPLGT